MANAFITNDITTYEALDILENTYSVAQFINTEYDDQFTFGGATLGQTLNIRKPARYLGRLGQAAQIESILETSVPLTLSYQRGVDTQVSSQNLKLDIDNYRKRVLEPQVVRLSNLMDQDVCNLAQGLNNSVGTPGTTPTTLTTYLNAKVKLDNQAAPADKGRYCAVNPAADAALMDNLKGLFNNTSQISEQYREGSMKQNQRTIGFDFEMDQNIFVQTVGTLGGTPTVTTTPANGANTIVTGSWSSTTLNAGDIISFISTTTPVNVVNPQNYSNMGVPMQVVVTANITDSGGAITIPYAPALFSSGQLQNVTNMPASGTAIFVYDTPAANFANISGKSSPQNLAVHKDFGTLACVDLPLPGGTDIAARAASRLRGISIRSIRDYISLTDQWIQRLDVLYGTAVLRQELGCRVCG